jgi:hypothetical protein
VPKLFTVDEVAAILRYDGTDRIILVDDAAAGRTNSCRLMARVRALGTEVRLTLCRSF